MGGVLTHICHTYVIYRLSYNTNIGMFKYELMKTSSFIRKFPALGVGKPHPDRLTSNLLAMSIAALIAIEIGRTAFLVLVGAGHIPVTPATLAIPHRLPSPPRVDLDAIVAAHLFGVPDIERTETLSRIALTAANLQLSATIASDNPQHGLAIITADGLSRVYKVGDSVIGFVLQAVFLDHIVLDRNGVFETLALPKELLTGIVDTQQSAVSRRENTAIATPPVSNAAIAGVMRVGAAILNAAGNLHGFRIYPRKNQAAFNSAKLHGGDLVVAVNGKTLEGFGPQGGNEIFDTIKNTSSAILTIERDGQTQEITVDASPLGYAIDP